MIFPDAFTSLGTPTQHFVSTTSTLSSSSLGNPSQPAVDGKIKGGSPLKKLLTPKVKGPLQAIQNYNSYYNYSPTVSSSNQKETSESKRQRTKKSATARRTKSHKTPSSSSVVRSSVSSPMTPSTSTGTTANAGHGESAVSFNPVIARSEEAMLSPSEKPTQPNQFILSSDTKKPLEPSVAPSPFSPLSPLSVARPLHVLSPRRKGLIKSCSSGNISDSGEFEEYDTYGFLKTNEEELEDDLIYMRPEQSKINLWSQVLENFEDWKDGRLQYLIFCEGLPDSLRPKIWAKFLDIEAYQKRTVSPSSSPLLMYQHLLAKSGREDTCDQIKLDIRRTFANHKSLRTSQGRQKLYNVLKAYSNLNEKVGYCQGMSFVCATISMNASEVDTFWMFACLMDIFHINYLPSMTQLLDDTNTFWKLLKHHLPIIHDHLDTLKVEMLIFTTRWFLTLFTDLSNWLTVLRIWDVILYEKKKALFRIGLAILSTCSDDVMKCKSIETLVPFLLNIPRKKMPSSKIMAAAFKIDVDGLLSRISGEAEKPQKTSLMSFVGLLFAEKEEKKAVESEKKANDRRARRLSVSALKSEPVLPQHEMRPRRRKRSSDTMNLAGSAPPSLPHRHSEVEMTLLKVHEGYREEDDTADKSAATGDERVRRRDRKISQSSTASALPTLKRSAEGMVVCDTPNKKEKISNNNNPSHIKDIPND